jgi:preprotein translocase SecE subunit
MATKVALEKSEQRSAKPKEPGAMTEFGGGAMNMFTDLTRFLSDVRSEMKKVVSPSAKEVRVTTGVVIIATFLFALYFFIVDGIFNALIYGPHGILSKLGGSQ